MTQKHFGFCNIHRRLLLLLAVLSLLFLSACSKTDTTSIAWQQSTELPSDPSSATEALEADALAEGNPESGSLPTDKPTDQPSEVPTQAESTKAPAQAEPTNMPAKVEPTAAPIQEEPTKKPTEEEPSTVPGRTEPTAAPAQAEPAKEPSKAEPTKTPSKAESTKTPATEPTKAPVKAEPTKAPTKARPTAAPAQAKPTSTPSIDKSLSTEKYVDEVLKQLITEDMSQVEQVKAVHDYIILNTAYYENAALKPEDYPDYVFTIEGVLKKGTAVCQGYAETFGLFMDRLGIACKFVVGKDLRNKVGHAWNMVSLDGKWYHVDTTWDDPIPDQEGRVQYKYFLVTDELMLKEHSWNQSNYPVCDSTAYQYYIYDKDMIASIEDYEQKFIELYLSGERTITILYPEEGRPDLSFFFDYAFLHKVDKDGSKHMSYQHYPTWRLGDYTVYTVIVD